MQQEGQSVTRDIFLPKHKILRLESKQPSTPTEGREEEGKQHLNDTTTQIRDVGYLF